MEIPIFPANRELTFHFLSRLPLTFAVVKCSTKHFQEITGDLHTEEQDAMCKTGAWSEGGDGKSVS